MNADRAMYLASLLGRPWTADRKNRVAASLAQAEIELELLRLLPHVEERPVLRDHAKELRREVRRLRQLMTYERSQSETRRGVRDPFNLVDQVAQRLLDELHPLVE